MNPGMVPIPAAMARPDKALVYDAKHDANGPDMADFQTPALELATLRNSGLPPNSAA